SHWSHKIYCGPQGEDVKVHYCYTFEDSERVAQGFLNEPVVGLDMEWYPYPSDDVKKNASVLQLACQDRIAIFHLARHEGKTAAQIVPPSLKRIIESADILKTGVHIDQADGTKLRDWLHLKPKGLFEVSHLYNLLANRRNASGYVLKTSKKMEIQVEEKLGLPLKKGAVRTSDWHKPLTQEQIDYAAADAYAGFMLFHVMNEQRKLLKPTPPRPEFAELRQPII
ncbi:ribonuclease H-like domain-containing protein, partial [Macrophomina phaseolina]